MESALTRDEQKELMGLLGLDPGCWGAMQLMRRAYHKKCLEYHPDKGGDGEKMKRMNVLYKKVMDNIERETPEQTWSWNSTEVRDKMDMMSPSAFYIRVWGHCNLGLLSSCDCLMCTLRKCHQIRCKYNSLVWLRCYCFDCFLQWFGMENNYYAFETWREVVATTPFQNLQIF
ncbi:small T antigen [Sciurus carolinensis polyomavirus 1]|uniref:Small t antigen n=1 Tax=Sciurus carolinensis polyomavirus 1 TaxID=2721750 RepID=A0A6G9LWZ1_9POLY|nr:small T antigen [Sciurus carolinensis polyomavirus 1]QIQ69364.1 small T antigen [Sciurus carolinensis polyomavirus 1]QIQ69370.1 small T antigen [Sciurus carolinensis polyomavirus 1]QIQ69376.1 small T antigen [Sciurus carolinensis polyomavirus 1]